MTAKSKNDIDIRLPDERWTHIVTEHEELTALRDEVLKAVENPERILAGNAGELFAVRELESGKWMVVVYRESGSDGFIITAFLTRRGRSLDKRQVVWPP